MNLYKVWSGDSGYLLKYGDTRGEVICSAAIDFGMSASEAFQSGADFHCLLIAKNIEQVYSISEDDEYVVVNLLNSDLIFAGVIHPQWIEERMADGCW